MTEAEWNHCTDPQVMLAWLHQQGMLSDRKARLFAVACCRRIWNLLTDGRSRAAVEVAEWYADGRAGNDELSAAEDAAEDASEALDDSGMGGTRWAAAAALATTDASPADAVVAAAGAGTGSPDAADGVAQCDLLRDIVNPFCSGETNSPWRAPEVVGLATTIYNDRSFDRLPELAQALEVSGCDDAELLAHLRGPGPHARGCHGLDLILDKE